MELWGSFHLSQPAALFSVLILPDKNVNGLSLMKTVLLRCGTGTRRLNKLVEFWEYFWIRIMFKGDAHQRLRYVHLISMRYFAVLNFDPFLYLISVTAKRLKHLLAFEFLTGLRRMLMRLNFCQSLFRIIHRHLLYPTAMLHKLAHNDFAPGQITTLVSIRAVHQLGNSLKLVICRKFTTIEFFVLLVKKWPALGWGHLGAVTAKNKIQSFFYLNAFFQLTKRCRFFLFSRKNPLQRMLLPRQKPLNRNRTPPMPHRVNTILSHLTPHIPIPPPHLLPPHTEKLRRRFQRNTIHLRSLTQTGKPLLPDSVARPLLRSRLMARISWMTPFFHVICRIWLRSYTAVRP